MREVRADTTVMGIEDGNQGKGVCERKLMGWTSAYLGYWRGCNLQGVGDGLDSCEISHKLPRLLISIAVIAIWLLMPPDAVEREVQLQAYAKGWILS